MSLGGRLFNMLERRRAAASLRRYRARIAGPADLGAAAQSASMSPFTALAPIEFALAFDNPMSQGDASATIGTRTTGIRGGPAGRLFSLGWVEAGEQIVINRTGALGSAVMLYVLDEWRRPRLVATGTFGAGGVVNNGWFFNQPASSGHILTSGIA